MKKLMILMSIAAISAGAFATDLDDDSNRVPTPIDFGFCSILKVPPFERDVWGIKLNILHSRELNVYGFDTGFIGCTTGAESGLQANVFNWVDGDVYGLQVGGVGSYVTGNVYGIQAGGLLSWNLGESYGLQVSTLNFDATFYGLQIGGLNWNYAGTDGMQIGVVNVERHDVTGSSIGGINFCSGNVTGGQIGVFNLMDGVGSRGFQLGLFNSAQGLCGVQIGLVNINVRGVLPVMVIANANF